MSKPMVTIHNLETDEIINREMTDVEHADFLLMIEKENAQKAEAEAKEAERQALLDKLGITADEAKLLLG